MKDNYQVYYHSTHLLGRPVIGLYGTGMWFVCSVKDEASCVGGFLRNDGKVFDKMQSAPLDLNGGTYFPTEQDAIDCVERFNAAQNQDDTCNAKETTDQTSNTKEQETE